MTFAMRHSLANLSRYACEVPSRMHQRYMNSGNMKFFSSFIRERENKGYAAIDDKKTSSSSSMHAGEISPPDIMALAEMARLGISEEEARDWEPQIASIVDWFGQLQEIDLTDVAPSLRGDVETEWVVRPDEPVEFTARDEMMKQVPEMDGPFVKAPPSRVEGPPANSD